MNPEIEADIEANLRRYRDAALAFANGVRAERGAAAISALPTGVREESDMCPLACALQDCGSKVEVSGTDAIIDGTTYELPVDAGEFVESFDAGCYPDLEVKV